MIKNLITGLALAVLVAIPASADSYVSAFGGANWDDVSSDLHLNSDTGMVVGGALGTHVKAVHGLRVEAELAYRQNDVTVFNFLDAKHNTTSLMGNLVYDVPVDMGAVHPYVMVGAGYAHTTGVIENLSLAQLEADGVAYQLGAGLEADVAEGVTAGIGYRYFAGPELQVFNTQVSDGTNQSVMATLTLNLD